MCATDVPTGSKGLASEIAAKDVYKLAIHRLSRSVVRDLLKYSNFRTPPSVFQYTLCRSKRRTGWMREPDCVPPLAFFNFKHSCAKPAFLLVFPALAGLIRYPVDSRAVHGANYRQHGARSGFGNDCKCLGGRPNFERHQTGLARHINKAETGSRHFKAESADAPPER
jgi:hypothetical protein